ncbi:MAG: cupin-like domain-containing protein [Proteobacteria bacterium]|nr:cupin-like domain-containing protein [Pseudomonadota bacterium]
MIGENAALASLPTSEASPAGAWIERVAGIGVGEFVARYRLPRRPVILTDALRDWPAVGRYTHAWFRREHGDLPVKVRGRDYRLAEIIDQQIASTAERPGPYPCTLAACTELLPDIPRFAYALPNRHTHPLVPKFPFEWVNHLEIFFGGPGGEFPRIHWDYLRMHAWIAQVCGAKEFTLFEPGQEHLLYVDPAKPWLSLAEPSPDAAERFPLLHQARRHTVTVRAGEALFLPCGTWHTARCLDLNITVAFDQLESSNWAGFVREAVAAERRSGRRGRALWLGAYLRALGPVLEVCERFGANRRADWGLRQR